MDDGAPELLSKFLPTVTAPLALLGGPEGPGPAMGSDPMVTKQGTDGQAQQV